MDPFFRTGQARAPEGLAPSLRRALGREPWTWPRRDDEPAWSAALALHPQGPPSLGPGQVPLLAWRPAGASPGPYQAHLLLFDLAGSGGVAQFEGEALTAWSDALAALPTAIPVLWRPTGDLPTMPLAARQVAWLGDEPGKVRELTGESFGLAFLLALASRVLDTALPGDVAASATISPLGRLGAVLGLEAKIRLIHEEAPGITRLLVASDQEDEARALAGARLKVVPCATAAEAVQALLDPTPRARATPAARALRVRSLFRLALSERASALDWAPVVAACEELTPGASEPEARRLRFCRAVAGRHLGEATPLPLPLAAELDELPLAARLRYVSHVVQQAADTAAPDPDATLALGERYLRPREDASPDHLRLLGAVGRLRAVLGRPEQALTDQREAIAGWLEIPWEHGLSYPLSEAYRLVAALGERATFDELESVRGEALAAGLLRVPHDTPYVELWRGIALLELHDSAERRQQGRGLLDELWNRSNGLFPGTTAVRALVRLERRHGSPLRADELIAALARHVAAFEQARDTAAHEARRRMFDLRAQQARQTLSLCALDLALAQQDELGQERAIAELRGCATAALLELLRRRRPPGEGWPMYLARFFPY